MVILRFEPGVEAPHDGVFTLVGHYGEPTGFVCECRVGEKLPERTSDSLDDDQALWYVLLEPSSEARLAA